jgi:hypothetical protein
VLEMTIFHGATIRHRRRCVALATAVITATGIVAFTPAAPASAAAASAHYEECLTNRSAECVSLTGTEIAIIVGTTSGIASNVITGAGKVAIVYLVKKFIGWWTGPGTHKKNLWSGYFQDGGDSGGAGANTNLCLADTSLLSNITFQPCGANGTVWIEEQDNNGGNFNFSRYWINNGACTAINNPGWTSQGDCEVMTAGSLNQGSPLFLALPEAPGGSLWQDWNP